MRTGRFSLLHLILISFLDPCEDSSVKQAQTGGVQGHVLHQTGEVIKLSKLLPVAGQEDLPAFLHVPLVHDLPVLLRVPLVHDVPVVEEVPVVIEPEAR